ncbi:MAG: site-specific integrase [Cytophagaceae bacterium]|nr:site-specific integrase [Cytophagaceae bacterium]
MTVNFYLDTTTSAILLVVGHKGKKFRISTGRVIKPTFHWNKDDQKVKSTFEDYQTINNELESLERHVKKVISDYKVLNNTVPTLEYVKQQISQDPNANSDKTFAALLKLFLKNAEDNNKKSTGYTYKAFVTDIDKFQEKERYKIAFENINAETVERYKKFLRTNKNSPYTIKNKLHLFKILLNFGKKNKFLKEFDEQLFTIKAPKSYGDKIYLTEDEIKVLEELKDLDPTDEIIRDGFLFQCYTGLRSSDLKTLKPLNIKEGLIRVVMHKTEQPVYIPVSDKAMMLLEKYKDQCASCFPLPTKEKYNIRIKEICNKAEIREEIALVRYEGTTRIEETLPKYLLVASHTGRRTFATHYILRGGRIEILSKLLGHSDITVTQRYFKDTPEVIAALSKQFI